MANETTFVVEYLNIDEEVKTVKIEASSDVMAAEMAESSDSDLGPILFVGTEEDYATYQKRQARKHKFDNSLSF